MELAGFFGFRRENEMAKAAASSTYELRVLIFVTRAAY
jgi:hypothetical protein